MTYLIVCDKLNLLDEIFQDPGQMISVHKYSSLFFSRAKRAAKEAKDAQSLPAPVSRVTMTAKYNNNTVLQYYIVYILYLVFSS